MAALLLSVLALLGCEALDSRDAVPSGEDLFVVAPRFLPSNAASNNMAVCRVSPETASLLVSATMWSHFVAGKVQPLDPPALGFTTTRRDFFPHAVWSTTVTIVPVVARLGAEEFEAVRIEVRGIGNGGAPFSEYETFKTRLSEELARSGAILYADSYRIK